MHPPLPVYPQTRLIRADARSVLVTWFFLALSASLWALATMGVPGLEGAVKLAWGAFLLAGLVHVLLALRHRCPACKKHPTVQGFRAPHPASLGQSRTPGWAGVVVSVARERRFVCIHCGAGYRT